MQAKFQADWDEKKENGHRLELSNILEVDEDEQDDKVKCNNKSEAA